MYCACGRIVFTNVPVCVHVQVKIAERDCINSRRDKIGITRHIMMHQVLYNVLVG